MNVWSISELSRSYNNAVFSWKSDPDPLLPPPPHLVREQARVGGGGALLLWVPGMGLSAQFSPTGHHVMTGPPSPVPVVIRGLEDAPIPGSSAGEWTLVPLLAGGGSGHLHISYTSYLGLKKCASESKAEMPTKSWKHCPGDTQGSLLCTRTNPPTCPTGLLSR